MGVTAIVPDGGDVFRDPLVAASCVLEAAAVSFASGRVGATRAAVAIARR